MQCVFQSNWHTYVQKNQANQLVAQTNYLDTGRELAARLTLNLNTFAIEEAIWETQRPREKRELERVSQLTGVKAYFNSGSILREKLEYLKEPLATQIFAETIRGIIQAETFLWEERGFNSEAEYNHHWEEFYLGSCRYYSNLDRVTQEWGQYVGHSKREGNLFVRFKGQSINKQGDKYWLTGSLSDCFHEVNVNAVLSKDARVESIDGVLLRTPDAVCKESNSFLQSLRGIDLGELPKREIARLLGQGQGCVHLIDVVHDMAQALKLYQK